MAIVTADTNRVDSFAAAHGIAEQDVIRWNIDYFVGSRTFWLPVGEDFSIRAPTLSLGRSLLVNGHVLLVNGRELAIN